MKQYASHMDDGRIAALLGDVVRSRGHAERGRLQDRLLAALSVANDRVEAVQPLSPTIGDEFQGLYATPTGALEATLLVRLALRGDADARFGVGWGTLRLHDPARAPFGQDGPAWWAAREAIDQIDRSQRSRESPRGLRTRLLVEGAGEGPAEAWPAIEAFLLCRDELASRLKARDARILLGLLAGRSPSELAEEEGISPSAVSQRAIARGLYALREATEAMRSAAWE
jgi:hypothetical protein